MFTNKNTYDCICNFTENIHTIINLIYSITLVFLLGYTYNYTSKYTIIETF